MPRRKPFSNKQRKAQLQSKRAAKRGDEDPAPSAPATSKKARRPGRSDANRTGAPPRLALESRFVAIPKNYLERTRDSAFSDPLRRPLPDDAAVFPLHLVTNPAAAPLTVPARPKFRYGQTKKEVERNEEGAFRKWLAAARDTVEEWVEDGHWSAKPVDEHALGPEWIHSPSWFETNLEVWRQLWRVVEASAILLLLIDARCPPVHCPPSLRSYLQNLRPRRQIILVLTKADLVDPHAVEGWKVWLREWWATGLRERPAARGPPRRNATPPPAEETVAGDDIQVVTVSSYDTTLLHGPGRARHRPEIPDSARSALVAALRTAHERILTPPASLAAFPDKLAAWKPSVRSHVDWDDLKELDLEAGIKPKGKAAIRKPVELAGEKTSDGEGSGSELEPEGQEQDAETGQLSRDPETEPLSIGLVGQPNVGKSSLLNALMGTTRVRASKTPGKTKHFQTIFWGGRREIKIVDCPGLVCPSLVPMELQAMAGILPISQIPSLPSCIHFACRHLPLEDVFHIPPPAIEADDVESKKTWREPRDIVTITEQQAPRWTAGGVMEARALDRGFLTAKGGRPDTNRAGNAMLRTLADGRVRWGFWPPGTQPVRHGQGVWLGAMSDELLNAEDGVGDGVGDEDSESEGSESGSEGESDDALTGGRSSESDGQRDDSDEQGSSSAEGFAVANNRSFFAALEIGNGDDDDDRDDGDDSV